jgi:hypothetical protein
MGMLTRVTEQLVALPWRLLDAADRWVIAQDDGESRLAFDTRTGSVTARWSVSEPDALSSSTRGSILADGAGIATTVTREGTRQRSVRVLNLGDGTVRAEWPIAFGAFVGSVDQGAVDHLWIAEWRGSRRGHASTLARLSLRDGDRDEFVVPLEAKDLVVGAGCVVVRGTYTVGLVDAATGALRGCVAAWPNRILIAASANRLVLHGSNSPAGRDLVLGDSSVDRVFEFQSRATEEHLARIGHDFASGVETACVRELDRGGRCWAEPMVPLVATDRHLVGAVDGSELVARELSDGRLRWSRAMPAAVVEVCRGDASLLVSCEGGALLALDAETGSTRWSHMHATTASGVLWSNGRFYFGSRAEDDA